MLTPDRAAELLDAGVDSVGISIDAYREATYRAIRPGLDFDRVLGNTLWLLRNRRKARVAVQFLAQRANEAERGDFVRHWRSLGARVFVSGVSNRAGSILCCQDWVHAETYGDLSAEPLAEVWNSPDLNRCRHLLWAHRPQEIALCRRCCRLGLD